MIDYGKMTDSIVHYTGQGFTRVEAPWTVSKGTTAITKPDGCIDYELKHNGKVLVGSGEQSFLYMMIKGYLPKGRYQTVTPCFRDDSFDLTHGKYFLKNELIVTDDVSVENLQAVISSAKDFFAKYFKRSDLSIVPTHTTDNITDESYDIECTIDGVCYELGSYGYRQHKYLEWLYATGCAEPRLSIIEQMYNKWDTTRLI